MNETTEILVQGLSPFQLLVGVFALASALGVVVSKNAVSAALSLMATLLLTAVLYLSQGAYFAGVVQILIYAGAIAVLFVFIVMLLDLKETKVIIPGQKTTWLLAAAAVGCFVLLTSAMFVPGFAELETTENNFQSLTARAISSNFVSTYMIPFQATGFLILAAILGVVMLSKSVQKHKEGKKNV